MSKAGEFAAKPRLRHPFALELAGCLILAVAFLVTVSRLDSDQLIPACCLVLGLTAAVVTVCRVRRTRSAVMLGGIIGSLGLFLAVKAVVLIIASSHVAELPASVLRLPRVLPGCVVFGLEGLLVGTAVHTLVRTSEHLRLSFNVIIFVVWGTFFVAYAYWLSQ